MNLQDKATECTQTSWERINQHRGHSNRSHLNFEQVVVELELLSRELDLQFVISGKILDSLHVLVQSVQEQQ